MESVLSKDVLFLTILMITTCKPSLKESTNIPTSHQDIESFADKDGETGDLKNDVIGHLYNYSVFRPIVNEMNTHRILKTTKVEGGHCEEISFKIYYEPGQSNESNIYTVFLKLVPSFWSKDFVIETRGGKTYHPTQAELKETHCYYKGYIAGWKDSSATISTCKGLNGFINLGKGELLYIEPLLQSNNQENVLNVDHLMYRSSDFKDPFFRCGTTDETDKRYKHTDTKHGSRSIFENLRQKSETGQKKRYVDALPSNLYEPYDSTPDTKYIELYVVYDSQHFRGVYDERKVVEKTNELIEKTKEIVIGLNHFFRIFGMYVILIGIEFWVREDYIKISGISIGYVLYSFKEYMSKKTSPNMDVSLLILDTYHVTSDQEDIRVGLAATGSICTKFDSSILVQEKVKYMHRMNAIVAHELGHILGLKHDPEFCNCTEEKCLMEEVLDETSRIAEFSDCSKLAMNVIVLEKPLLCLKNFPTSSAYAPSCGNGVREIYEDCDCGSKEDCTTKCCDATTCRLASNARCATGKCCDLETCQIKESGIECRSAKTCCDLPEYCNGNDEFCPEDEFVYNGHPCKAYEEQSICYDGECNTYDGQCQYIWGETAKKADPYCYKRFNVREDYFGHCAFNVVEEKYRACEQEHVMCGLLHCQSNRHEPHIQEYITAFNNYDDQCKTVVYYREPHLGLVRQGVMCAPHSICLESRCVNISLVLRPPCECDGTSICTNKGKCYFGVGGPLENCSSVVKYSNANLISEASILGEMLLIIAAAVSNINIR